MVGIHFALAQALDVTPKAVSQSIGRAVEYSPKDGWQLTG
jgi:DNA-binding transcriptional regulator YdaS (Cro superfamily)